ncbi:ABC transporter permease [Psychrobacter jeotgali]|uniref:ABC transporter permease n=1 Tax=Psychrobacter jeotgali TaxID=179010 RepID=UPI001917BA35|nr:ABC transporter permease [Psychrobacter jeotgali]
MRLIQAFLRSAVYERRFLAKNPWDLAMVIFIPLVAALMIWWIFSSTQITDLPIGVIDNDHSPTAGTLLRYLEVTPDIVVAHTYHSPAAAEAAILQREIYGVVTIPENFESDILSGKPSPIVLQVNAQYGTHSGIIQKSVQSVATTLSVGVEIQRLVKQGMAPTQAAIAASPIGIQRISLFNAATDYQQFLASTIIPALLHILAMVVGATTIGRELRDKQIGRWYRFIDTESKALVSKQQKSDKTLANSNNNDLKNADKSDDKTPNKLKAPEQVSILVLLFGLSGKYFWPILAYSLWSILAIWLATYQHSIAFSSILATYVCLVVLMILSFWLGAIFTLTSYSLRAGLSAAGFISAPSYAFAGITFPYIAIRDSAKYWADALPLTHYLKLHLAQLQMKAPVLVSLPILYGLILATVVAGLIAVLLTKRALAHPERWGAR